MKPLTAVREYHYWSERLATKLWQDNVSQSPAKINASAGISNFSIQAQEQDPPQTRAARAIAIEALLADHIVTDLDYMGPLSYLAGRSQMVLSSLRDEQWEDTGAVTLFADLLSGRGRRIAVCLFGSEINVCGCEPTVPAWRQYGWTSSSVKGVELLLNAAANAENSKDPQVYWRQAAQEAGADATEICWNAANICYAQGERYRKCRPWRRGYTIGHYQDAEWLAQIYFIDKDIDIGGPRFDEVYVGAAFWVRSGSARAWVPYNAENVRKLRRADRPFSRQSLARIWRKRPGQNLVHKPYPELSSPEQSAE